MPGSLGFFTGTRKRCRTVERTPARTTLGGRYTLGLAYPVSPRSGTNPSSASQSSAGQEWLRGSSSSARMPRFLGDVDAAG